MGRPRKSVPVISDNRKDSEEKLNKLVEEVRDMEINKVAEETMAVFSPGTIVEIAPEPVYDSSTLILMKTPGGMYYVAELKYDSSTGQVSTPTRLTHNDDMFVVMKERLYIMLSERNII